MDPFSALAVATAALQVIDFSAKLVTTGTELFKHGSTNRTIDLEWAATELRDYTERLQNALQLGPNTRSLAEAESKLCDRAGEAKQLAEELLQLINESKRRVGKNKVYEGFRSALVTISTKSNIDRIENKLDSLRKDLVLHILVTLKLQHQLASARSDGRFESLGKSAKAIAEGILDNRNYFTTGIKDLEGAIEEQGRGIQERLEETVAAIATLQQTWMSEESLPRRAVGCNDLSSVFTQDSVADLRKLQADIVDFLWFRDIHARRDRVMDPYEETFSWIFDDKDDATGFPRLLEDWRSEYTMLTATFYFWNAGNTLQKSQAGLLRSILYDALEKHPELIPVVFPMHCRLLSRGRTLDGEPTLDELKTAFSNLMKQEVVPMKICLFIDGVDEFEGDHEDCTTSLRKTLGDMLRGIYSRKALAGP
ncbi:hypothetical protein SAPIO_CDS6959 [Scedosporium apiospermum]|uniref:Nephrocystin 3-like N-terminal domain-containing protein n=1 Tax=Pseudallescheria apiosperma TaxID=563466 RepID=A0A084G2T2_PSEDA|nr:uncharacterized protein SAPIO_CDS6959 [Scedosporium apiospermum]KEZ41644.1 hypothetical protein SAPIO_CDS6959 [Scedosporium apiospermum]